jgi:hypothetical protein
VLEKLKEMYSKIPGSAKIEKDKEKVEKYEAEQAKHNNKGAFIIQNRMSTPGSKSLFAQSSSPSSPSRPKQQIHSNEGN